MSEEKKGLVAEFKEFISRGNVMDLAVGMIMGAAFTSIVNSLVNDMIMPLVGLIIGGIDFTSLSVGCVMYGNFIQQIINFLIIAVSIFAAVKVLNAFNRKKEAEEEAEAEPSPELTALLEIRDLLKEKK